MSFEQGSLDSLCGIYSIINAEKIINKTDRENSQALFNEIIHFLSRKRQLVNILTTGMILKNLTKIMDEIVGERIPYKELPWRNVATPGLDAFWESMEIFLDGAPGKAVILCMNGYYDHWTVIKSITPNQIKLTDSYGLSRLQRIYCTTSEPRGKRHHFLKPAQTYFLSRF
jgi:hypothetical protein